ncbi:unnamed protein product [Orchesella dallaii]|uniref:Uncharacterized protein n=1 Tax=Orchesella dallaii TaxID=48710 RepID=A0ABP1S405_9HEXA
MKIIQIIVFSALMYSSFNLGCTGALLKIFKEPNFKGANYNQSSWKICTDLPENFQISEGSLKTDGCIAIYVFTGCNDDAYGFVIKSDQPTLNKLAKEYQRATDTTAHDFKLRSLRDCTTNEIASDAFFDFWEVSFPTKKSSQFKGVCECIPLPKYESLDHEYGVNTYGKCFEFYSTENCTGGPIFKISKLKSSLPSLEAQSAKLCRIPIKCARIKTSVFNIIPSFNKSMLVANVKGRDAAVDATQTFINNGTSTIEEVYSVQRILTETVEFEFSKGFRELASSAHKVETTTENKTETVLEKSFGFKFSIPIKAVVLTVGFSYSESKKTTESFKTAVKTVFEEESEKTLKNSKLLTVKTTRKFEVRKKITLPTCTRYQVSSNVQIVEGIKMTYDVQFEIKGNTESGRRLPSEDIIFGLKQAGSKLRFIKDSPRANNFTVVAESTMAIKVSMGLISLVRAEGEIMHDCIKGHEICACDKYEIDLSKLCTQIPPNFRIGHGSLLTNGCVAVFFDKRCIEQHWAFVVLGHENSIARVKAVRNLHDEELYTEWSIIETTIQAFTNCYRLQGQPFPSVDYGNVKERDICGCVDSEWTAGFYGDLTLHGYCFKFYKAPKCTGEHTVMDSLISNVGNGVYKSFEPCQIPIACGQLTVRVFNLEPAFDSSRLPGRVDDEAVDAKQTFINNGTATMIELYDIGRELTETAEISVSQSIRQLNAAASSVKCEVNEEVVKTLDFKLTGKVEPNIPTSSGKPSKPEPATPTKPPTKKTTKKPKQNTTKKPKQKTTKKPSKKPDTNEKKPKPDDDDDDSDEVEISDILDLTSVPPVDASFEAEASYGIVNKVSKNLKDAFEKNSTKESESTNSTEKTFSTTKKFQVQKKIIMPGCSQYEVAAFVTIAHDVTLEYKMYFEVTGEAPSTYKKMSAEDIRIGLSRIPQRGLRVLKDHPRANNYTVIVESSLELKLNFGLNSVVKAEGKTLWDCIRRHKMCKCDCPGDGNK